MRPEVGGTGEGADTNTGGDITSRRVQISRVAQTVGVLKRFRHIVAEKYF